MKNRVVKKGDYVKHKDTKVHGNYVLDVRDSLDGIQVKLEYFGKLGKVKEGWFNLSDCEE